MRNLLLLHNFSHHADKSAFVRFVRGTETRPLYDKRVFTISNTCPKQIKLQSWICRAESSENRYLMRETIFTLFTRPSFQCWWYCAFVRERKSPNFWITSAKILCLASIQQNWILWYTVNSIYQFLLSIKSASQVLWYSSWGLSLEYIHYPTLLWYHRSFFMQLPT